MIVLCQLKEFGLSCFGCCGNSYSNKRKLIRDIKKNTWEFKNNDSISSFMTRTRELRDSGVCANIVLKDGKFFCPGYPILNNGRDYRDLDPDCHKEHLCKAFSSFQTWDKKKQQKFLDFIKLKKLDSYIYSIKMDNDSLLKEFEEKNSGEMIRTS